MPGPGVQVRSAACLCLALLVLYFPDAFYLANPTPGNYRDSMMVRTRFAPSPTGYLHIGGVRTALFNWLFARKHSGQFILRIDDTDQQRNVEAALKPILDGFRWLGIDWDEGPEVGGPHEPYFQSQRTPRYQEAVETLLKEGKAYRDYATTEEVAQEREAAEKEKRAFVYSRRWMAETTEDEKRFESEGRSSIVRLKMPREGKLVVKDLIRGNVEFDWAREQDHVIQRADGSCLYHLATVVDDRDFEITHVIRAEEHLSNTPRQIFIAEALGHQPPEFAHIPFVAEPGSRKKFSKRHLDKYLKNRDFAALCKLGDSIAERAKLNVTKETFNPALVDFYRDAGFLPHAVVNYLLLLGWALDDRTEYFTVPEMIEHFSLERVNHAPASFDPVKLTAFQGRYMQELPMKQKVAACLKFLQAAEWVTTPAPCSISEKLTSICEAAGDRLVVAGSILDYSEFFVEDDAVIFEEKPFGKRLVKAPESVTLLQEFRGRLESVEFTSEALETELKSFVAEKEIKIGQIIHALRVAVTGKAVGFGMFETLAILGKESSLVRIDRAIAKVSEVVES